MSDPSRPTVTDEQLERLAGGVPETMLGQLAAELIRRRAVDEQLSRVEAHKLRAAVAAPAPDRDDARLWIIAGTNGPLQPQVEADWDGEVFTDYAAALASLARCQETFPDYHLYEMRFVAGVGGVPAEPQPERQPADELRRTQMKAALVECCEAGKVAYPDPCPWHGVGAVPQDREAGA